MLWTNSTVTVDWKPVSPPYCCVAESDLWSAPQDGWWPPARGPGIHIATQGSDGGLHGIAGQGWHTPQQYLTRRYLQVFDLQYI